MATILTKQAIEGYYGEDDEDGGYLRTSPAWYGYRAGKALREYGVSPPKKATMGRGYQINAWTAATRFNVIFNSSDDTWHVERINE